MRPLGIVLRARNFRLTAHFAHLLDGLPRHTQLIVQPRHAGATRVPLLFEFTLPHFQPQLLAAQSFELQLQFVVLLGQRRCLIANGELLLTQRGFAPLQFARLLVESLSQCLGRRQSLAHRRQLRTRRRQLVLFALDRVAQLHQPFGEPHRFRFRFGARRRRRHVFMLRALRPLPRSVHIVANARKVALAHRQIQPEAREFALHLVVAHLARNHAPLHVALLGVNFFQRFLGAHDPRGHLLQRRLLLAQVVFKLHQLGIQCPQFTLHAQRTGFVRPPSGHHAPLIARAIRRYERILGILARQLFRRRRAFRQVRRTQPGQKLLRRRAQRFAKLHDFVQSRNHAVFRTEVRDGLVLAQSQIAQRIYEERRPPADLVSQHGNARSRVVIRFHDHELQFLAQVLLQRRLVLFFNLGVIRQHAHRAKILAATAFVGRKKLLHRVRGIRAVVQNVGQRAMPRPHAGKRVAHRIRQLAGGFAFLLVFREAGLQRRRIFFQRR